MFVIWFPEEVGQAYDPVSVNGMKDWLLLIMLTVKPLM